MDIILFYKLATSNPYIGFNDQFWVNKYFDIEVDRIIKMCGYSYKEICTGHMKQDEIDYYCNIVPNSVNLFCKNIISNTTISHYVIYKCYR